MPFAREEAVVAEDDPDHGDLVAARLVVTGVAVAWLTVACRPPCGSALPGHAQAESGGRTETPGAAPPGRGRGLMSPTSIAAALDQKDRPVQTGLQIVVICTVFATATISGSPNSRIAGATADTRVGEGSPVLGGRPPDDRAEPRAHSRRPSQRRAAPGWREGRARRPTRAAAAAVRGRGLEDPRARAAGRHGVADRAGQPAARRRRLPARARGGAGRVRQDDAPLAVGRIATCGRSPGSRSTTATTTPSRCCGTWRRRSTASSRCRASALEPLAPERRPAPAQAPCTRLGAAIGAAPRRRSCSCSTAPTRSRATRSRRVGTLVGHIPAGSMIVLSGRVVPELPGRRAAGRRAAARARAVRARAQPARGRDAAARRHGWSSRTTRSTSSSSAPRAGPPAST